MQELCVVQHVEVILNGVNLKSVETGLILSASWQLGYECRVQLTFKVIPQGALIAAALHALANENLLITHVESLSGLLRPLYVPDQVGQLVVQIQVVLF